MQSPLRFLPRAVLCLPLALTSASATVPLTGCSETFCTLIGCENTVRVRVSNATGISASPVTIHASFAGSDWEARIEHQTVASSCNVSAGNADCMIVDSTIAELTLLLPADYTSDSSQLDVTVTTEGGTEVARFHAMVATPEIFPNGEDCGGACRAATDIVELTPDTTT